MRSRFRSRRIAVLAASVAALALGSLGAASASAVLLPEISPTPTKTNPLQFSGEGFGSEGGGSITFRYNGQEFKCKKVTIGGEFLSPKEVVAKASYTGCANELSEEIGTTEQLKGLIGHFSTETKEAGMGLAGTGAEQIYAKHFGIPSFHDKLLVGVIGTLAPVNSKAKTITLNYAAPSQKQQFTKFICPLTPEECLLSKEYKTYQLKDGPGNLVSLEATIPLTFKQGGKFVEVEVKS